jgi:predicted AlkP superfamily phosphohydrolase/phosphomutase
VSVDPGEVKGVFFSNRKMKVPAMPSVVDIVPTILSLYGIPCPESMDGRPLQLDL